MGFSEEIQKYIKLTKLNMHILNMQVEDKEFEVITTDINIYQGDAKE